MTPDSGLMKAVETLDYRVTAGDVASQAGLDVKLAEQGLLTLASEAGGHMQVSEAGEIAYLFPKNFRSVLQNKYFRLRVQAWWSKVWQILFYIIRMSFGVALVASILLITIAIVLVLTAMKSAQGDDDDRGFDGGGMAFLPNFWIGPEWYLIFQPNYYDTRRQRLAGNEPRKLNFLEAVFSFLFGDGNPNADLDERRWRAIATVIRNHGGAVVAEQMAPYLDLPSRLLADDEDYMLPVLIRFNGQPEVSPDGQIVYHFPELQVTAAQQRPAAIAAYLKESLWRFSQATSGQTMLAAGLGAFNLIGALVLGWLLRNGIAGQLGGLVAFVGGIYGLLLAYGIGFLAVPLVRYWWIQQRNQKLAARNERRQQLAENLNQGGAALQLKMAYAQQFAAETIVSQDNLAYSTETDLTEQEAAQSDKIDAEWRKRLER